MSAEVRTFDHTHLPGEPATRPIVGLPRRYMTLETLADLGENPNVSLPAVAG